MGERQLVALKQQMALMSEKYCKIFAIRIVIVNPLNNFPYFGKSVASLCWFASFSWSCCWMFDPIERKSWTKESFDYKSLKPSWLDSITLEEQLRFRNIWILVVSRDCVVWGGSTIVLFKTENLILLRIVDNFNIAASGSPKRVGFNDQRPKTRGSTAQRLLFRQLHSRGDTRGNQHSADCFDGETRVESDLFWKIASIVWFSLLKITPSIHFYLILKITILGFFVDVVG